MRRLCVFAVSALAPGWAGGVLAQQQDAAALHPGAGIDLVASTDGDKTDVVKLSGRALLDFKGADNYLGAVYERAWFKPLGGATRTQNRGYVEIARPAGDWRWQARIGTDGDTVLGSASLRKADWSREFMVEREIVETPMGVDHGIYYTFAAASFDIPAGANDSFTAMAGVQPFTGKNVRLHLRGNYVHMLKTDWGLSAQLAARYYHSTTPGEYDYYSPRDYLQLLPLLQLRRVSAGWEYRLRAGYGAQRATGSDWQDSRYAFFRVTSPPTARNWVLHADVTYANTSITSGPNYDYVMGSLGIAMAF